MKTRSDSWLMVILLFNMLVALTVFSGWFAPVRSYIVFAYLLFCPGLSLAAFLPSRDKLTQFFLIMVVSVAIDTTIAEILLYARKWSPEWVLVILMVISLVGVTSELVIKTREKLNSFS
jgi:hypothetical protein